MQAFLTRQNQARSFLWENYVVDSQSKSTIGLLLGRIIYNSWGKAVAKIIGEAVYDLKGNIIALLQRKEPEHVEDQEIQKLKEQGWQILTRISDHRDAYWVEKRDEWSKQPLETLLTSTIPEMQLQTAC